MTAYRTIITAICKYKATAVPTLLIFFLSLLPLGLPHTQGGLPALMLVALVILFSSIFVILYRIVAEELMARCSLDRWLLAQAQILFTAKENRFLAAVFCLFLLTSVFISYFMYDFQPLVIDAIAQYVHAKILASGQLAAPLPPLPEFFGMQYFIMEGGYYSLYPPGHLFMLAVGHLLHAPWLINPLMGALSCLAIYYLAKEVYGEKIARGAGALCLVTPWLLLMSSGYMNHATAMLFATLFIWLFLKGLRTKHVGTCLTAGASLGYLFITRPFTAAALSIPFVCYGLWRVTRYPEDWRVGLLTAAGFLPFVGIQLAFNYATTGNPFLYGSQINYASALPGFGAIHPDFHVSTPHKVHTWLHAIGNGFNNLNGLHFLLFRWPVSSLIFLAAAFLLPHRYRSGYLFLLALASLSIGYAFYFFQDWCFGPRFLYEVSGLLVILSAYGMAQVPLIWRVFGSSLRKSIIQRRLAVWLALCLAAAVPLSSQTVTAQLEFCRVGETSPIPSVEAQLTDKALLFVEPQQYPLFFQYNPPAPENAVIAAQDLGDGKNEELIALYPGREVYRWTKKDGLVRLRSSAP